MFKATPRMIKLAVVAVFLSFASAYRDAWFEGCGSSPYPDAGTPFESKVIGGKEARPHEFPWTGSLRWLPDAEYEKDHFCGVSLIHPRFVLTAAHCVRLRDPADMVVILGEHAPDQPSSVRRAYRMEKHVHHPDYHLWAWYDADIAVVKLVEEVELSENVFPVCAPEPGNLYLDDTMQLAGWGTTRVGEWILPEALNWASLPILNNDDCQWSVGDDYEITDNMICAGEMYEHERDACQGDSGGPLTTKRDGKFELVGIVSWGIGCASGYPGVYTRVPNYVDWVITQINTM